MDQTTSSNQGSAGATLTEKASQLARSVQDQAKDFGAKAAERVKEHSGQLSDGAKDVASQATEKLMGAVEDQKSVGADFVSGWAGAVRKAADGFDDQIPQAATYIRSAAEQIDGVAEALRDRKMGDLVQEVQDFARRQPTAFLGISVLAGFALVRFLKSSSNASSSGAASSQTSSTDAFSSQGSRASFGGQSTGMSERTSGDGRYGGSMNTGAAPGSRY